MRTVTVHFYRSNVHVCDVTFESLPDEIDGESVAIFLFATMKRSGVDLEGVTWSVTDSAPKVVWEFVGLPGDFPYYDVNNVDMMAWPD